MRIFTIEPNASGVAMHVDTSVMKSQIATFTALEDWTERQSPPRWCPCQFQDPLRELAQGLPPHDLHSLALSDMKSGYSGVHFAGTDEDSEEDRYGDEIAQMRSPLPRSAFSRCFRGDGLQWVRPGLGSTTVYDVTLPHETRGNTEPAAPRPNLVSFYFRDERMPTRSKYSHGQEGFDEGRRLSVVEAQDRHKRVVREAMRFLEGTAPQGGGGFDREFNREL